MMSGRLRPLAGEVITHDVDPIDIRVKAVHLCVLKIWTAGCGNGERVSIGATALPRVAERVEAFAQRLQHQREVFLVLREKLDSRPRLSGILPIEIDAV